MGRWDDLLFCVKAAGFYESLQTEHHLGEPVSTLGRTCNTNKSAKTGTGTKAASERVTETDREDADPGHLRSLRASCVMCKFLHKQL